MVAVPATVKCFYIPGYQHDKAERMMNQLQRNLALSPHSATLWAFVSPTVEQRVDRRTCDILCFYG